MTPEQIRLIQTSFLKVLPIADTAAALFYQRLFELDGSLQALFPSDLHDQGRKLMRMLQVVVNSLHRLETIVPALQEMGRRHVRYGVLDQHYATVGAALIWTLEQGLGEHFTREVEQAWGCAYTLLAETMKLATAPEAIAA